MLKCRQKYLFSCFITNIINCYVSLSVETKPNVVCVLKVHGLANNSDISSTYLNLTIKYPSTGDAGVYKCLMSYIDDKGLVTQDTAQAELRINSKSRPWIASLVLSLLHGIPCSVRPYVVS